MVYCTEFTHTWLRPFLTNTYDANMRPSVIARTINTGNTEAMVVVWSLSVSLSVGGVDRESVSTVHQIWFGRPGLVRGH